MLGVVEFVSAPTAFDGTDEHWPTVLDMVAAVRSGEASPVELVDQALERIANGDRFEAFLTVSAERARADAKKAEEIQLRGGVLPPLLGVPIAVKDLHETAGIRTTYGSLRYEVNVPVEDCVVVERLRRAGAIVVGKTNVPAFGLLSETKNRLGPPCSNPYDTSRTSGGSSGGSAVAVATGMVPAATGSDAAGSINVPASFCGVYGIKPSLGRVPNVPSSDALLLMTSSGPITRTVDDAALLLEVMSGYDPRDPMSLPLRVPHFSTLAREWRPEGIRVAVSTDLGIFAVDAEVAEATRLVASRLESLGCRVAPDHPVFEDPMGLYVGLYVSDSRNAGFTSPEWLGELYPESLAELRDLPALSAEQYVALLNRWLRLKATMTEFFTRHDVLVVPTTSVAAFAHDHIPESIGGREVPDVWTSFMPFTPIVNMTGQPAANVLSGFNHEGLPLGALVIGRVGEDELVLQVSRALLGR
jgi:aspartyl-tRNA(Asn)/glutamyl-tRNA(Gln) amidotransferase subunit A